MPAASRRVRHWPQGLSSTPGKAWHRTLLAQAVPAIGLGLCSLAAQATLVTFAELPWSPSSEDPPLDDQPLNDQYASLGMLIRNGLLKGGDLGPESQYMLGGNGLNITFTGVLPTYVSFEFRSATNFGGAWADASGPGGYTARVQTSADLSGPQPVGPPIYASFASPGGIAFLDFGNYYNFRFTASVDNVYFGLVPAVPEPGTVLLMGAGLAVLLARRDRRTA